MSRQNQQGGLYPWNRLFFQILDCFTIPVVLFLSCFVLRVQYKLLHFIGVFTCLIGVGALILADMLVDKYGDSSKFSALLLEIQSSNYI